MKNLDVKSIREAANKAKQVGQMLAPDAAVRVQLAIDAARDSARRWSGCEQAAAEIDLRAIRTVTESRTAFLGWTRRRKSPSRSRMPGRST